MESSLDDCADAPADNGAAVVDDIRDSDADIPLGISLYALMPFSHYLQGLAKDRCDSRIYVPKIELAKEFRPDLVSQFWGLPTAEEDLTALGIDRVKAIASALYIFVSKTEDDDLSAWVAALRAPIKTTGEFCQFIIKQDTAPHDCLDKASESSSYVEHLQRQSTTCDDLGRCLWGPASHFISHAWSYDWEDLILALVDLYHSMVQYDRVKCYFWLDICCVDQHRAAAGLYGSAFWEEKFQTMVRNIGHTVCIIMPWSRPVCMTRIWCLWEIYSTIINEVQLSVAMTEKEGLSLQEATFRDIDQAMGAFLRIDAAHAEATDPEDKRHIGGKIERSPGGYERLNRVVKTALLARFVSYIAFIGDAARLTQMMHDDPSLSLETPVDIQSAKNRLYTPLQHACRCGHTPVVQLLLRHGASATAFEKFSGMNALHLAVLAGHYEVAHALVESGRVDPFDNGMCAIGLSPAHLAAEFGRIEILTYFISTSSSREKALGCRGRGGETLLYCCDDSYAGLIEGSVRHCKGPPQGLFSELARRGVHEAPDWDEAQIVADRLATAEYLTQWGVPAECPGQEFGSACRTGDHRRVAEMLAASAELRAQINTPFKCSKRHGSLVFTALMQLANLATSVTLDHVAVLDILLDHGADPTLRTFREDYDADGNLRCLTKAATDECVGDNLLHRLARYSPSLLDNYGDAEPSMSLGDGAQVQMARLLLTKGGLDIEARNRPCGGGVTALHYAAMGRKPELVRFLVEEGGSDIHSKVIGGINDGMTPLGLAEHGDFAMGPTQSARKRAVVEYLQSVGASGGKISAGDCSEESVPPEQSISVENLVDMGFERAAVEAALAAAGGNAEEAMNRLLGGDL